MSIKIMQEVWESAPAPIEQGTLLVLLSLADNADEKMRSCYPGIGTIAERTRLSERQVRRCLSILSNAGIISIRRGASHVKTNLYTIAPVSEWVGDKMSGLGLDPSKIGPVQKPDRTFATVREDTHVLSDRTPMSPKPSVTPDKEPSDAPSGKSFNENGDQADPHTSTEDAESRAHAQWIEKQRKEREERDRVEKERIEERERRLREEEEEAWSRLSDEEKDMFSAFRPRLEKSA